ncbi:MAG: hypothetical protein ACREL9_05835 [Gemmatimonadales bacterium]
MKAIVLAVLPALLAGCSDALERGTTAGQRIAIVNQTSGTLSLVAVADLTVEDVAMFPSGAAPRTLAARGSLVAVPLGDTAKVVVLDFSAGTPVVDTFALSGPPRAGGADFQNDSILWVALPTLNRVARVNVRSGDTTSVAVGNTPLGVVAANGRIFVVNSNAPGGTPAGPSWVTAFICCGPARDSIPVTGSNAGPVVQGEDGFLYVIAAGRSGLAEGRLSIVDPASLSEVAVVNGLGESPGTAVYHPSSRLLIASAAEGVLEVNALTRAVVRGPGSGVRPGGTGVTAIAVDARGRVYATAAGSCVAAGPVHALSAPPDYDLRRSVTAGVCPAAAAVVFVPAL